MAFHYYKALHHPSPTGAGARRRQECRENVNLLIICILTTLTRTPRHTSFCPAPARGKMLSFLCPGPSVSPPLSSERSCNVPNTSSTRPHYSQQCTQSNTDFLKYHISHNCRLHSQAILLLVLYSRHTHKN